ncbi:hypothetical protein N431DRAFT_546659 [Stipitochalara longipes BDJ]|nr:hypothetical protein N431DRAFT_546659 [Stipitochalara longipes BDJ]
MAHLTNPLATPSQLYALTNLNSPLPVDLQHSIRFYTSRLTQAAGLLLRLPQDITAQANVLLYRYWLVDPLLSWEFSDVSAAVLYLTAKISASPRSLRSITNVYAYLLSPHSHLSSKPSTTPPDPESYYLSEGEYITFRNRILNIEGQILNALGFNTHVALPHPLAITYLQTLDVFSSPKSTSSRVAKRTVEYLNTALLSPQMLYLTHQPNALATAAVYLAAREEGVKLPESEWWTVFDVEREELGFLCVGMGSLLGFVEKEEQRWGEGRGIITRATVREEIERLGLNGEGRVGNGVDGGEIEEDEEAQMARMLDEKVAAAAT